MENKQDIPQQSKIEADFLTFLASTTDAETVKLYTFALDALTFANKIQIYHWTCKSGFHHTHWEAVYKIIRDFADSLVETVLSMGYEFKFDTKSYMITAEPYDLSIAMLKLTAFREELEKLKKQYQSKISLDNLFGDTIEKIDKEIGLLKNFS